MISYLKSVWKSAWNQGRLIALVPYLFISLMFIVLPVILLTINTMSKSDDPEFDRWQQVKDKDTWNIMFRSVYLGLISSVFALMIAFPFTYIIARHKSKAFRMSSYVLMLSPLLMFTVAKTFALRGVFVKTFGTMESIRNMPMMISAMIYLYLPFMVMPLFSVLQQMPNSLLEASEDLGFNRFNTIIKVVVPYSLKAIFSSMAVVFMLSATSLVIKENFLGGYDKLSLIGNKLDLVSKEMLNYPEDRVLGSILSLLTIGVMMSVYAVIYFVPSLIRKMTGGINV